MFLLVGTPGRLSWSHSFQRSRAPSWCAKAASQGAALFISNIYFTARSQSFFKAKFVAFSASLTRGQDENF
jgi:hypothetical protein